MTKYTYLNVFILTCWATAISVHLDFLQTNLVLYLWLGYAWNTHISFLYFLKSQTKLKHERERERLYPCHGCDRPRQQPANIFAHFCGMAGPCRGPASNFRGKRPRVRLAAATWRAGIKGTRRHGNTKPSQRTTYKNGVQICPVSWYSLISKKQT